MRIADRYGRDRDARAIDVERLDECAGAIDERNIGRRESRHAHVDDHFTVVLETRHDDAAGRFDADFTPIGETVLADVDDEAARAVAALLDLAAIGVEYPVAEIGIFASRLDDEHLVASDAEAPVGEQPDLRGRQYERRARGVDDDEVVAEPLHFREAQRVRARLRAPGRAIRHGRPSPSSPLRVNGNRAPPASVALPSSV